MRGALSASQRCMRERDGTRRYRADWFGAHRGQISSLQQCVGCESPCQIVLRRMPGGGIDLSTMWAFKVSHQISSVPIRTIGGSGQLATIGLRIGIDARPAMAPCVEGGLSLAISGLQASSPQMVWVALPRWPILLSRRPKAENSSNRSCPIKKRKGNPCVE